jgi:hypothetical protein
LVSNISNFYIYAHVLPGTRNVFYVGKGKENRCNSHYGRNRYWKAIVAKYGFEVIIICNNLSEKKAFALEKKYIEKVKPRANFTKGGAGGRTALSKQAIRAMASKVAEKQKQVWSKRTKEERAKILKKSHDRIRQFWKSLTTEELSAEQSRRAKKRLCKKIYCVTNGKIYEDINQAKEDLNIKWKTHIHRVCRKERKNVKGFVFEYYEE